MSTRRQRQDGGDEGTSWGFIRRAIGGALLLAQVIAIGYARFVPARYFCWAPYDAITLYTMDVRVDGRPLDADQVAQRYGFHSYGRDNRSPQHVIDVVEQYEHTYGRTDDAEVVLRYRTNGGQEHVWRQRWTSR